MSPPSYYSTPGGDGTSSATGSGADTPIKETDVDSFLTADISPARVSDRVTDQEGNGQMVKGLL